MRENVKQRTLNSQGKGGIRHIQDYEQSPNQNIADRVCSHNDSVSMGKEPTEDAILAWGFSITDFYLVGDEINGYKSKP